MGPEACGWEQYGSLRVYQRRRAGMLAELLFRYCVQQEKESTSRGRSYSDDGEASVVFVVGAATILCEN